MIKSQKMSLNTVISQRPGNIVSDMDGEKVMLSINKGKYYNLGEIGGRIWELIEQPAALEYVVNAMLEEYDVERGQCEEQVLHFLELLVNEELAAIE
ncbi:lasso peptide biosynthesis PqqD family chaperone [Evansella sp. LMS18]|uniref:lasso peptide biosynthesis PqqD family chaperone n=1 Tax=Evansella sp. LMS18 TaxID=2924033 RepID=UPI0020D0F39C|nr:lasso peptide biosynthesis PqqD family chaperone [Evansella sp. LMS18]UTR10554.1 lasso peptide biosynthesis PqqD family chaperone [Evansella sp. LMS18]